MTTAKGGFAGFVQRERTKPVIAAVDGPALAGGTEIVLACDLVVASKTAVFGIPEVKRNLVAAAGGLFRLPRKIPRNIAMELALTGRLDFPAERAHHFGLVNQLCEEGEALAPGQGARRRGLRSRAPGRAREPQDRPRGHRPARRGRLEDVGRGHHEDVRHRGLQRGPHRLRREARPGVEGPLSPTASVVSTSRGPGARRAGASAWTGTNAGRQGSGAKGQAMVSMMPCSCEELGQARARAAARRRRRAAPTGPRRRRRRPPARRPRAASTVKSRMTKW